MTVPLPSTSARGRRSKRPSGDERERAIRETLGKLLEERPFNDISIDDLARGAGISRPTFYFYYGSKEAVLLALMAEIVLEADAVSDVAQAAIEQDPQHFLRQALAAYVTTFGSHRWVIIACNQAAATNPRVRELWNLIRERWVQMGADGITAERKRIGLTGLLPARELSIALLNMNEGVMYSMFAGEQPSIAEDRVLDVLTNVWANAVYEDRPLPPAAT
jgi:AcrR family transcriptional regulator